MEIKNEPNQYQWIINEGLLRDEGTLFGIAGANIEDKITAIRDYYRIKKAATQTKREQLDKEMEELQSDLAKALSKIPDLESNSKSINLVPTFLQIFLYGGICYFNFYLESYWLSPVIHSTLICVGLYLFGLFSVFIGRSIMYNAAGALAEDKAGVGKREAWKIYLEEFGVPLVVSLFISILPANAYPIHISVIATLFFFLLFLLGGKGLVNTFFRARAELGWLFQNARRKRDQKKKLKKRNILQEELGKALAILGELNGEEDYKIKILTSEYKLAFESRQLA